MSTNRRIYLDFNATAPLCEPARLAMVEAMSHVGNPSSIHAEGRQARDHIERARAQVAAVLGSRADRIVFTSGGTEANYLGVAALAVAAEHAGRPRLLVTSAIEHPSLRGPVAALAARGWTIGTLDDVEIDDRVGLVAVGLVNHEVGSVLADAVLASAANHGVLVHLDAVQAAGKLPMAAARAESIAISAHKLGGPQGIGALAISADGALPLVEGGHQERGRRPGTENLVGIVGFGAAAAAVDVAGWTRVAALGDRLEAGLVALGARIHAGDRRRIGGTVNAAFAGARGQDIAIALDLAGIAVSTGAACTSGTVQPSPVLLALGYSRDQAEEAVRFSLGRTTTEAEIDETLRVLPGLVARARIHR